MQARQPSGAPAYTNFFSAFGRIVKNEGPLRLYRGVNAIVVAAVPSHAVHFATYEKVRERLGATAPGLHPIQNGLAGGVAAMAHDAVVTPLDVVKQRLQLHGSSFRGIRDTVAHILKNVRDGSTGHSDMLKKMTKRKGKEEWTERMRETVKGEKTDRKKKGRKERRTQE